MTPVTKRLAMVLALSGLLFSSCTALDFFKGGPEPPAEPAAAQTAVSSGSPDETAVAGQDAAMDELQDKIDRLETKVSSLESQVAGQKKIVYTMEYSDPAQLYQKARNLLLENDVDAAADLFATFARQHPEHGLADNALYWLGECHYTKGDYSKAVAVFKDLVSTYPKAEKVPDAMLKTGYAYLSLDDINRASHFLKLVIKKYPFSPAAEKAQEKLSTFD